MLRRSIGARLALAYLAPSLAGLAALGFWVDTLARRALEEELGRKVVAIAAAAAATIPVEPLGYLEPGDEETRTYARVRERLEEVRAATGARRLAVFDREGRALADAGGGARIGAPLPELARDRLELADVLAGTPRASLVLFEHEGTSYKAGYAPVVGDGAVVAAVLAEGSAEHFAVLAQFRAWLVGLGVAAAAVIALVSFGFARTLTRPIRRLVDAARRIGQGDLETAVDGPRGADELAYLGHALDEMRERLLARDRQLKLMLAGIAHEVRNPLGGMELYAGLLAEELAASPEQVGHVQRIRREIAQLERIVGDFLDYARERPPERAATTSRALLEEVADLTAAEAERRGVAVRLEGDDLPVRADAALVKRALLNLVHNALHAAPRGTVVHLRGEGTPGRVRLVVADEGKGVPEADAPRVFEPFFTTKEKGTGLGLAFVKKIAEAHGGAACHLPTPGGGATFVLELPAG